MNNFSELLPESGQDFKGQGHYSKVKHQAHITMLHTYIANQCSNQVSSSYTLRFPRYSLDTIFKVMVSTARLKVKSSLHHDAAHLHPLINVTTMYQLPAPYSFRDIAQTKF